MEHLCLVAENCIDPIDEEIVSLFGRELHSLSFYLDLALDAQFIISEDGAVAIGEINA